MHSTVNDHHLPILCTFVFQFICHSYIDYEDVCQRFNKDGLNDIKDDISSESKTLPWLPFSHSYEPQSSFQRHKEDKSYGDGCRTRLNSRHCYEVGESLRSRNDIVDKKVCRSKHSSSAGCRIAHEYDGAFIKRSDGSFTYAIVVKKYLDPKNNEDTLVFQVCRGRSTKSIARRQWKSCIRVLQNPRRCDTVDDGSSHNSSPVCAKDNIDLMNGYLSKARPRSSYGSATSQTSKDSRRVLRLRQSVSA